MNAQNWKGKNIKSWSKQMFGIVLLMITESAAELPPWERIVIMGQQRLWSRGWQGVRPTPKYLEMGYLIYFTVVIYFPYI